MKQDVTVELAGGKQIKFETGRMAKQASGAAFTTSGDNAVLATATASPDPKEGIDFFPLTVEYREFTYAGGRIPGGFIKREGRPSEKEMLTSRQIDRPIRPLFPEAFRNETQVVAFVYSADKENDPDVLGINGASCALALSDIPFHGPVGAVRVGLIDGNFIVNPTYAERAVSVINIMVVGTEGRHCDGGVGREGVLGREGGGCDRVRACGDQEDLRGDRRAGGAWRARRSVRSTAVGDRPGLPERAEREGGRPAEGCAGYAEASEVRELRAGEGDQGRAEEGAAGRRCRRRRRS